MKHAIQELIDHGKIPASEFPNVANNPLPNYGARVNALFLSEDGPDPVHLIKPVKKRNEANRAYQIDNH